MSSLELYIIEMNGDVVLYREYSNSARGAFILWDWLEARHLPPFIKYPKQMPDRAWNRFYFGDEQQKRKFWDLVYNKDIPEHHRLTLWSTYDGVMVKRENLKRLGEAFKRTASEMVDPGHWDAHGDALIRLSERDDILGVCWNQTSVNADAWANVEIEPERVVLPDGRTAAVEEDEQYRPYNINEDTFMKQYWLFEHFNKAGADRSK